MKWIKDPQTGYWLKALVGWLYLLVVLTALFYGRESKANEAKPKTDSGNSARWVASFDGQRLLWPEYRFWLNYSKKYQPEATGEALRQQALEYACNERAIQQLAEQEGLTLSAQTLQRLESERDKNISVYGSTTEYLRMVASLYGTEQVYAYLQQTDALSQQLFTHLYGTGGRQLTPEQVAAYQAKQGYLSGYYLWLSAHDKSTGLPLDNAARKAQQMQLEQWREQIITAQKPASQFKALIREYSAEPRVGSYVNGRQFVPGTLPHKVEVQMAQLPPGQLSEVIATSRGDYLLMPTALTAMSQLNNTGRTLRYWAAYDGLFKQRIRQQCSAMPRQLNERFQLPGQAQQAALPAS